jgi:hypothetical protein
MIVTIVDEHTAALSTEMTDNFIIVQNHQFRKRCSGGRGFGPSVA